MKNINVAFFGTSDKSLEILKTLHTNFSLKLTVTKEDTKVGRNHEIRETQVKKWIRDNGVECLTITNLKSPTDEQVLNKLVEQHVNYVIVADFSFMIPKILTSNPNFKMINIHFSLLPKYRGASPVQFAVLNGEKETGITYQILADKMDTGEIISQVPFPINTEDTTESLLPKMFQEAASELPNVLDDFNSGILTTKTQDETNATYTYSKTKPKSTLIYKDDAKIDWSKSDTEIYNMVRAFNPWPIAWTTIGELKGFVAKRDNLKAVRLKIYSGSLGAEIFKPNKVQVEGGNVIDWKDFVNGYVEKA